MGVSWNPSPYTPEYLTFGTIFMFSSLSPKGKLKDLPKRSNFMISPYTPEY